jgi:hypothetical protein
MADLFPETVCPHTDKVFTLTPQSIHYGHERCAACGQFLRFVPYPVTVERQKENAFKIHELKRCPLSIWAKGFLLSLEKQGRHFSPKQQTKLNELYEHYYPASDSKETLGDPPAGDAP